MNDERYVGFYTHRPFWAGSDIHSILQNDPVGLANFTDLMGKVIYAHVVENYQIKVCQDGMFLFQLSKYAGQIGTEPVGLLEGNELVLIWSEYLAYINAILILFESSFLEVEKLAYFDFLEITIKDVFGVHYKGEKWNGHGVPSMSIASYFQMARFLSSYREDMPLIIDSRLSFRVIIRQSVFQKLFQDFDILFQRPKLVRAVANLAKALSEYKIARYDTSLVMSWFIIESFLNNKWETWLQSKGEEYQDKSKRINSERLNLLTGRDYTISVITNILELSDVIPNELFKRLDKIRKVRNEIVHQSGQSANVCTADDCCRALMLAKELIEEELGFIINLNLNYSVAGL